VRCASLLPIAFLALGCAHSEPALSPPRTAATQQIQPDQADALRELPLQGVKNGRDLGGIVGTHGPIPNDHFFRTASLENATENDKKVLVDHNVKLDLDLRSYIETLRAPDALAEDPRFHYVRISLFGVGIFDWLTSARGDLYVQALAKHAQEFRKVFHQLASEPDGAVLFHCAEGKDRTGLVAAMLLSLAGVSQDAIVHNYAVSAHYLNPTANDRDALAEAERSNPPSAIEEFLKALNDQYGGARAYLLGVGVSEADVDVLSARLGQK
jgi:protein-tyrosine phosphatase